MDKEYKRQRVNCIFLSFMLCFSAIVSSLNVILNLLQGAGFLNTGILYVCYFVLLAFFIFGNIRYMPMKLLYSLMFFLVSYFVTLILFPQNARYMWTSADDLLTNPTYILSFFAIFGYIASFYIKDMELFCSIFEKFSLITVSLLATRFFIGFIIRSSVPEYMTFSYNLLLPTTFLLLLCIKEFKVYRAIFAILGISLIFVAGCRGAVLGLIVSPLLYIFFFGKVDRRTKYRTTILLVILLFIVLFSYDSILQFIGSKLTGMGLESRNLEMLLNSSITDDSGRNGILQKSMSNVDLLGKGLWGAQVILDGKYPHNVIVEILVDYGWVLGIGILGLVAYVLLNGFIKADKFKSVVLCALLSSGIIRLLLSGSFLGQEPAFYVLIALCINNFAGTNNTEVAKESY